MSREWSRGRVHAQVAVRCVRAIGANDGVEGEAQEERGKAEGTKATRRGRGGKGLGARVAERGVEGFAGRER